MIDKENGEICLLYTSFSGEREINLAISTTTCKKEKFITENVKLLKEVLLDSALDLSLIHIYRQRNPQDLHYPAGTVRTASGRRAVAGARRHRQCLPCFLAGVRRREDEG